MAEDPLEELVEALRRSDGRTWRRHLSASRWRHRRPGTSTSPPAPLLDRLLDAPFRSEADVSPPRRRSWFLMAIAGVAVAVLLMGALRPVRSPAPPLTPAAEAPAPPTTTPTPTPTPSSTSMTAPAGVRVWPVEGVEVVGREVRRSGERWEVGTEGDVVAVGDWDCDRVPTPAVLRPTTGAVVVFDGWGGVARRVATVIDGASLRATASCGEVVVDRVGGGSRLIDMRSPAP